MTVVTDEGIPLAAEFPGATREQWRQLVAGVLRKAGAKDVEEGDVEEALATRLPDGIAARPLYTREDAGVAPGFPGSAPFVRAARPEGSVLSGWDVRQWHADPDPVRVNDAILTDLENGVSSIWLTVGSSGVSVNDIERALAGVYLNLAPVVLDPGAEFEAAAAEMLGLFGARGFPEAGVPAVLGADPLGVRARTGEDVGLEPAVELALRCHALNAERGDAVRALVVDGLPFHEAGGSAGEELGCVLGVGVAYVRALTGVGLSVGEALGQLEFRLAVDVDQFVGVAKLRAARWLWGRVAGVCGVSGVGGGMRQHAVSSRVMVARRDPWVNMLRSTVAGLAAGVGGADAVTVLPFDEGLGLSDGFARRVARNTSTILVEESHVGRVIDPGGGSWYVESLTRELAVAGWAWFQEIEAVGGFEVALGSGLVGERIAGTWAERSRRLATRREPITGVSEFAEIDQEPVVRPLGVRPVGGGLPRVRRDDAFEALRVRSDALTAAGGRPRVFLAGLGPVAAHTARAVFAANFFRAGGIAPVQEAVSVEAGSVGEAFVASGALVACLCGPDAEYAERAEAVAGALRAAGARRVLLAGRLRERPWGVDELIHLGSDAVAVLSALLDVWGDA